MAALVLSELSPEDINSGSVRRILWRKLQLNQRNRFLNRPQRYRIGPAG